MKKIYFKLSFSVIVLFAISCKKNSNSKSKTELLTQKAWNISNAEVGRGGNWQTDSDFASLEACEKDNQLVFKTDKTIEVNEGAIKCDESDPQTQNGGSWDFTENETKLILGGDPGIINQLDENILVVTSSDQDTDYRLTFRH